jgi:hypothetical protein
MPLVEFIIWVYCWVNENCIGKPVRHNMTDPLGKAERTFLNKTHLLVETVIGQLTGQFNINKV